MAKFTRADLRRILGDAHTEDMENQLIALHLGVVDPLKDQIATYKNDSERLVFVQKELDDLKAAGDGGYKKRYEVAFLVMGLNIYGSSFFTALGNGLVSALLSFLRTLLFQVIAVLVLPIFFELNGVWFAIVAAEGTALIVTIVFLLHYRKKYGY